MLRRRTAVAVTALAAPAPALAILGFGESKMGKCSGEQKEMRECASGACAEDLPVDCEWGPWSDFGPCTCEGLKERHRTIVVAVKNGGKACTGSKVEDAFLSGYTLGEQLRG